MIRDIGVVACGWVLGSLVAFGAEQAWEIQGEFISLKAGDPGTVILRIADGGHVEVPLAAFSETAQAAIRELTKPDKRPPSKVAYLPPALAEDLAACRTAADAADVCRLALAGAELAGEARDPVESLLAELEGRAVRGESRLGGKWVGPEVAAQAAEKAGGHLAKSLEMIRLGNLKLAEQELRQASQADPANGRADFLLGVAYMLGVKPDLDEAARAFEEVVRREPDNGAAWNNLAVCNVQRRRYPAAVTAFRNASTLLRAPQPVVGNLGLVIRMAADRRSRISDNQLEEITSLYHGLLQAQGVAAPDAISGPIVLGPDGTPLAAGGLGDLKSLVAPAGIPEQEVEFAAVVVAPGVVASSPPSSWRNDDAGLSVVMPDGSCLPAKVAAKTPDDRLVLLKCVGLTVTPMPLRLKSVAAKDAVLLVAPPGGSVAPPGRATIVTADLAAGRPRFIYELQPGTAWDEPGEPGTVILDAAGRVTGLGVRHPVARRFAATKRLGFPVEAIRKLLAEIDPPIADGSEAGDTEKPSPDEIAARCRAAVVRIRAGGVAGSAP